MFPDPYSAVILLEFEHQERLRRAARDRIAASAEPTTPSRRAWAKHPPHVAATWLRNQWQRMHGLSRARLASRLTPEQALTGGVQHMETGV